MLRTIKEKKQLRALLDGDAADSKQFFDEYFPRLYRFTIERVSGEHHAAREIVQNTLSKVLMKINSFRGESSLFTWMCSICNNEITDFQRQQSRFHQTIALHGNTADLSSIPDMDMDTVPDKPEDVFDRDQKTRLIHIVLDSLPARYGNIIEWKYMDGLSRQE